jgi:hypothetical protein
MTGDLPRQRTRFRKGEPAQFYMKTSYGDSAYAYDEDDLAEWLKVWAAKDRHVAVYELKSIHKETT